MWYNLLGFFPFPHSFLGTKNRNGAQCKNLIMMAQTKFALIVHDENVEMFSGPKEAN